MPGFPYQIRLSCAKETRSKSLFLSQERLVLLLVLVATRSKICLLTTNAVTNHEVGILTDDSEFTGGAVPARSYPFKVSGTGLKVLYS